MKYSILLSFLVISSLTKSQNEADRWHFGLYAALDFTSGAPVVANSAMTTSEGTASISDQNGNLLFYTNGVDVFDSSHAVMFNGTALKGDVSTTHSAMIVPSPSDSNQYYLFTAAADGGPNGFCYSIVDMTLNSGYGAVTNTKNVPLTDSISEKIAAIQISSGAYWIVTHKYGTNEFYAYKLTTLGLEAPVITSVGTVHNTSTFQNTYGQMKFNMCGDKLALALGYMDQAEIYDFNMLTGVVSNPVVLPMPDHVYGIEFSQNSNYLYVTCYDPTVSLSQFDVTLTSEALIQTSESPISSTDDLYGLQLGPDGKIYVSRSFSSSYLGVINNPEQPGFSCNYVDNGIDLDPNFMGNTGALSLPSFMQSYLGDATGCPKPVSTGNEIKNEGIDIFPNPSNSSFILTSENDYDQILVLDVTGKVLNDFRGVGTITFGENFPPGIYFVSVLDKTSYSTRRIIKSE